MPSPSSDNGAEAFHPELSVTAGPLELNETNVVAVQVNFSFRTACWPCMTTATGVRRYCGDSSRSYLPCRTSSRRRSPAWRHGWLNSTLKAKRETPTLSGRLSTPPLFPTQFYGVMRGCPQVEFACRQSTMLLQEFDEAVAKYQVPLLQRHGPLELSCCDDVLSYSFQTSCADGIPLLPEEERLMHGFGDHASWLFASHCRFNRRLLSSKPLDLLYRVLLNAPRMTSS